MFFVQYQYRVRISTGFNFYPRPIFTNVNTHLDRISRECYAFDNSRTTEERRYSTCPNLSASRLRIIMFTISFLYFWEIACLGNNIRHNTRGRIIHAQGYWWCDNLRILSSLRYTYNIRKYRVCHQYISISFNFHFNLFDTYKFYVLFIVNTFVCYIFSSTRRLCIRLSIELYSTSSWRNDSLGVLVLGNSRALPNPECPSSLLNRFARSLVICQRKKVVRSDVSLGTFAAPV